MAMNELLLSLREKYMCIHTKSIFSHHSVIILFFLMPLVAKGQYQVFDSNSANAVLEANAEYIRAYGQMTQRAIQIRHAVQPYREMMIQKYRKGCYKEALDICYNANKQFVYYVFDNKGMSDMELLAGECAVKMQNYELAITWYNMAKEAGESNANSKLLDVFNVKLSDARSSFYRNDFSAIWNDVTLALKTGWESGECYYFYGKCYENWNNFKDAKKMYKLAKKKKYSPAKDALKELKK